MPTRIIRDGILTSERINALSPGAELFYRRLMSVADDHGRYSANLTLLKSYCYPLKPDIKESAIKAWLAECQDAGVIALYMADSKSYLEIQEFGQRVNGKSKFPGNPGEVPGTPGDSRLGGGGGGGVDEGEGGGGSGGEPPVCPHQEIIALYHELVPTGTKVKVWGEDRMAHLRTRWREDAKRQSLGYWRKFFVHVAASDFLTGKTCGQGKKPFQVGLDWLVLPSNFAKVIEGKYHERA